MDIAGHYQCTPYIGTPSENGWHHVAIEPAEVSAVRYLGAAPLKWNNQCNCSWSLTPGSDPNSIAVGHDCPYYNDGYKNCIVVRDDMGKVMAVLGPGNERYDRTGDLPHDQAQSLREAEAGPRVLRISKGRQDPNHQCSAFIMPLSPKIPDWRDLAFLAAISASSHQNSRMPVVLAPNDDGCFNDDSVSDVVSRLQPQTLTVFASSEIIQIDSDTEFPLVIFEEWDTLESTTIALSNVWVNSDNVVLVSEADYGHAVMAASFACRIDAPLFFLDQSLSQAATDAINRLHPSRVFMIGDAPAVCLDAPTISLSSADALISWMKSNDYPLNYIAVVNPNDRCAGVSQKLSLTAPMYTARREGLAIPVPNIPVMPDLGDGPALGEVLGFLRSLFKTIGHHPEHLALIGGVDVIPICRTDSDINNSKIWAITDIPYGQLNGQRGNLQDFQDIAVGRIFTNSICGGSTLAARTVTYELLRDGLWDRKFVEAGQWGFPELRPLLENVGFVEKEHLHKTDFDHRLSIEAAAILHKDHSGSDGLGDAVNTSTGALYAPAVVLSRGCHAAGIDECNPSVASMMLGRGAVAYVGSPRSPISANTLTEVAFFNALLYGGKTLGQAMREALNKAAVHRLDGHVMGRYCIENELLLGDPGLCLTVPSRPEVPPVTTTVEGNVVTVDCPCNWIVPIHHGQLVEWKCAGELFTCAAAAAEPETHFHEDHDNQVLYYTVAVTLPPQMSVSKVIATEVSEITEDGSVHTRTAAAGQWWPTGNTAPAGQWWPTGKHYAHKQSDGMTTIRWRLRLVEYEMRTGTVRTRLKSAQFRLT